jgi:1-acyl-sn-glycerol-3-phosphate acyltransferase
MKGPPPYLVRRLVIAPLVVVGAIVAVGSLPLWLIGAAFASRYVPGRWRALRVAWFLFLYLMLEAILLVVLFAVWIASGFGWKLRSPRFVELHYRLAAWFLRRVMGSARATFDVAIRPERLADDVPTRRDRPVLVFCRHAGPGDSFLLIDALLNEHDRRPRIVLKDLLRFDPCVDVALGRLPTRFVPSSGRAGSAVVDAIGELARTMTADDALVIFPEGGNFTPRRHARAIEKLDEIDRPDLAERARSMRHLLPPKPTGALTAIEAAPTADVVFVGHVGLERLVTVKDVWRGIPMDASVTTATWRVPAEDVPPPEQREAWLYDQWAVIDAWIGGHLAAS